MRKEFDSFNIGLTIDEDGEWQANLLELPNVSAFGSSPEEAISELKIAWDAMKISYQKHHQQVPIAPSKKNYSGQFSIRLDKRVHMALAMEAAQAGVSLNSLVSQTLIQHVKLRSLH